jgi:thiamine biosynthesis lipoprotein
VSRWVERWWAALGTHAHVQICDGPRGLADRVVDVVEEMEASWSRFRPSSDLCRLNSDPREVVPVSPLLAELLARAVVGWRETDGWFDPSVLDALERAGYQYSYSGEGSPRGRLVLEAAPGLAGVQVDPVTCLVRRPVGLRLDLGGIGKGWAADRLATWLLERGARSVCVGFGGDIRVAGDAPAGGWRIPVDDPAGSGPWFDAQLPSGAIVTSTTLLRRWRTEDGAPAHHLIDPRTGLPSRSGVHTVVVAAAEAWWAEVLAKAALVAGPQAGRALLDHHGVTAWMSTDEGVAAA